MLVRKLTRADRSAGAFKLEIKKDDELDQDDLLPEGACLPHSHGNHKKASKRELCDKMNDIVLYRSREQMIDCVVSMASISKAHLDGISCEYQSLNPVLSFDASAADVAIAIAAATLEKFQIAAKRAGISHGISTICGKPYPC